MVDRTMPALLRSLRNRVTSLERRLSRGTYQLPDRLSPMGAEVTDWNQAVAAGFYWGASAAHQPVHLVDYYGPTAHAWWVGLVQVMPVPGGAVRIVQTLTRPNYPEGWEFSRQSNDGGASWSAWEDIGYDTGWLTSGLALVASSDCSVTGYSLRKIGHRVTGVIRISWTGGTVTPDSAFNFTDKNAIVTMPAGWRYGGGYDHFLTITASGVATYGGRARIASSGAGWIDLTHAMTSRAIANDNTLYITLDYLV